MTGHTSEPAAGSVLVFDWFIFNSVMRTFTRTVHTMWRTQFEGTNRDFEFLRQAEGTDFCPRDSTRLENGYSSHEGICPSLCASLYDMKEENISQFIIVDRSNFENGQFSNILLWNHS